MKLRILILSATIFFISSCSELQQIANQVPNKILTNIDIASGLREALTFGIDKQVSKLTQQDGFYKNTLVKILLPAELQQVDKTLRNIGLSSLADEGLKLLNRAAEDAVNQATPIFVNAVKEISFNDAKKIVLGADNAATNYLKGKTTEVLYQKFHPIIMNSFQKVGADSVWENLINRYNSVPFVNKVNPDLTDYVTQEALTGVYTMIAVEEKEIRTKVASRTTTLLQRVFALQD